MHGGVHYISISRMHCRPAKNNHKIRTHFNLKE